MYVYLQSIKATKTDYTRVSEKMAKFYLNVEEGIPVIFVSSIALHKVLPGRGHARVSSPISIRHPVLPFRPLVAFLYLRQNTSPRPYIGLSPNKW